MSGRMVFRDDDLSPIELLNLWLTRKALLKSVRHLPQNISVLELGSGYHARNLKAIEDRAEQLVAIDFNLSEKLKKNSKFHCIESSIEEALTSLKDNTFDLILVLSVLEHLENPLQVLKACHNALKKGGILMVLVPNWVAKRVLEFLAFKLEISQVTKDSINDHKMYYGKRDLWPLLIKAGFVPSSVSLNYKKFGFVVFAHCIK